MEKGGTFYRREVINILETSSAKGFLTGLSSTNTNDALGWHGMRLEFSLYLLVFFQGYQKRRSILKIKQSQNHKTKTLEFMATALTLEKCRCGRRSPSAKTRSVLRLGGRNERFCSATGLARWCDCHLHKGKLDPVTTAQTAPPPPCVSSHPAAPSSAQPAVHLQQRVCKGCWQNILFSHDLMQWKKVNGPLGNTLALLTILSVGRFRTSLRNTARNKECNNVIK